METIIAWILSRPPDHDLQRFPPKEVVAKCLSFNETYYNQLKQARTFYGAENQHWVAWCNVWKPEEWKWHTEAMSETWDLRQPWRMLENAQTLSDPAARWLNLMNLRECIGEGNYIQGTMPIPVPLWRFRETQWD